MQTTVGYRDWEYDCCRGICRRCRVVGATLLYTRGTSASELASVPLVSPFDFYIWLIIIENKLINCFLHLLFEDFTSCSSPLFVAFLVIAIVFIILILSITNMKLDYYPIEYGNTKHIQNCNRTNIDTVCFNNNNYFNRLVIIYRG